MRTIPALSSLTVRQALQAAAALSVAMLAAVLVAQYGFGLHPCHLCVLQRYPYVAVALLAGAAVWRGSPRLQYVALTTCAALFFVDAGIAFYHTGVEYGWFPGPSGCTSSSTGGESLEEMRRAIMNAPLVSCDQAMVHIFGLSLAAWNFLAATAAGAVAVYVLRIKRVRA